MLAGLLDPLAGVGRVGAGAGGAGVAVHPLDAVGGPEPLEAVPLDDAREAPPLAGADHIDVLDLVEDLDRQRLPLGDSLGRGFLADLPNVTLALSIDLPG